ncbi:MAG: hypothetical protein K8I27_00955 [Planctomycetes bacterium]|nr:hypothetical protein [Planctomycetota bacterium]
MKNRLLRIGLPFALYACAILTLPSCSSVDEVWEPEALVEETHLGPMHFKETAAPGKLNLTVTQKTRTRETPMERLVLVHEETFADFDWDSFGLVFWSVLGGIASVGLYFLFAFVIFDTTDNEKD